MELDPSDLACPGCSLFLCATMQPWHLSGMPEKQISTTLENMRAPRNPAEHEMLVEMLKEFHDRPTVTITAITEIRHK